MLRVRWRVETDSYSIIVGSEKDGSRDGFSPRVCRLEGSWYFLQGDSVFNNLLMDEGNRNCDVLDSCGDGASVADVNARLSVLIESNGLARAGKVEEFGQGKIERRPLGSRKGS